MNQAVNANGREWKSKANAEYQKVISSIFSLSTAALVIPTLFLKDFLGLAPGASLRVALSWPVYLAWVFFFSAIFCCVFYYYASAKWLKKAYGGHVKWLEESIEKCLDRTFWTAVLFFISGLVGLVIFMATFVPKS